MLVSSSWFIMRLAVVGLGYRKSIKVSSSFSEEKEPKRLYEFGTRGFEHPGSHEVKVFAPLFSKSGCFLTRRAPI
jgi:hypothetical protein